MKIKIKNILLAIMIIPMLTVLLIGCHQSNNPADKTTVNEKIIQIKDFSVNSDSTELNTSAKGTMFVKGTEGVPEHIQIIAQIEIDPQDWGGVVFYVPKKWNIANTSAVIPKRKPRPYPRTMWHHGLLLLKTTNGKKWWKSEQVIIGDQREAVQELLLLI